MSRSEKQTLDSFDYQWKNLPEGKYLLSDPEWRENVCEYILDELQVSPEWIRGKSVLDVGCGQGRWSYGFDRLGCHVVAVDASPSACEFVRTNIRNVLTVNCNIYDLSSHVRDKFDIVWCWGVLHHLPNPML